MGQKAGCIGVCIAAASLWLVSGTFREKPVLSQVKSEVVRQLESDAAEHPRDAARIAKLAQGYLETSTPGLAIGLIEGAPVDVRANVRVEHVYARALVEQGRNLEALAVERKVVARCAAFARGERDDEAGCDSYLFASATRRSEILEKLVELGVEDSHAEPEASRVAYFAATREARVLLQ